jgi:putative hydrolase of HD superfamily
LEFEERETPKAKFSKSIDRLMPMMANYESGGKAWKDEHVPTARLREINAIIKDGCVSLCELSQEMIDDAIVKGLCK